MPSRSRFSIVVAAMVAVLAAVAWLRRVDIAPPTTGSGTVAWAAHEVEVAGGPAGAGGVVSEDAAGAPAPAREPLAVEPMSVHGIVVDVAGNPIGDAEVYKDGEVTTKGVDGAFTVYRGPEERASHVWLYAAHDRFSYAGDWFEWGRDDVRLVMAPRVPVEVRVVDENGEALRAERVFGRYRPSFDLRDGVWCAALPEGIATEITVTFPKGTVARECLERRIEVAAPGPVRVRLVATTMLPREVHVVDPDGLPVGNATVELIDARGCAFAPHHDTVDECCALGPVKCGDATTDATGMARPLGPVGRSLVVRAVGDGFAPAVVTDVRVPGEHPVVVQLGRGAIGRGRVLVDSRIGQLIAAGNCKLHFVQAYGRCWPDALDGVPLAADGSFAFSGAPPGEWEARLFFPLAEPARRHSSVEAERVCTGVSVGLRGGDNSPLVIDLRTTRWTDVHLRLFAQGSAARGERVTFAPVGLQQEICTVVFCDSDGRCATRLRPGRYWLQIDTAVQEHGTASGRALLEVGDVPIDRDLHLGGGEVAFTFVDEAGKPVRGLKCAMVATVELDARTTWTCADGDGVLHDMYPEGEWAVVVRTKELVAMDYETLDWSRDDALLVHARARRRLGTITVRTGEVAKATFVVPDDVPR